MNRNVDLDENYTNFKVFEPSYLIFFFFYSFISHQRWVILNLKLPDYLSSFIPWRKVLPGRLNIFIYFKFLFHTEIFFADQISAADVLHHIWLLDHCQSGFGKFLWCLLDLMSALAFACFGQFTLLIIADNLWSYKYDYQLYIMNQFPNLNLSRCTVQIYWCRFRWTSELKWP